MCNWILLLHNHAFRCEELSTRSLCRPWQDLAQAWGEVYSTAWDAINMNDNSWTVFDLEMCLQGARLQRERFWRPDGSYPLWGRTTTGWLFVCKVYDITVVFSVHQGNFFQIQTLANENLQIPWHVQGSRTACKAREGQRWSGSKIYFVFWNVICYAFIWFGEASLPRSTITYLWLVP